MASAEWSSSGSSFSYQADRKQADYEIPYAFEISEIKQILSDYRYACENTKLSSFDGVEVNDANGYLLDQFLQDGSNKRDDIYGGSIKNRARLLLEVVDIAIDIWGKGRIGVRLSPYLAFIMDVGPEFFDRLK